MPVEIIGMVGTRDASEIKGPLVDGPVVDWMDGPVIDPDYLVDIARAHDDGGLRPRAHRLRRRRPRGLGRRRARCCNCTEAPEGAGRPPARLRPAGRAGPHGGHARPPHRRRADRASTSSPAATRRTSAARATSYPTTPATGAPREMMAIAAPPLDRGRALRLRGRVLPLRGRLQLGEAGHSRGHPAVLRAAPRRRRSRSVRPRPTSTPSGASPGPRWPPGWTTIDEAAAKYGRKLRYSISLRPIIADTEDEAWEKAEWIAETTAERIELAKERMAGHKDNYAGSGREPQRHLLGRPRHGRHHLGRPQATHRDVR